MKEADPGITEGVICYFTIHTDRPDSNFPLLGYLSTSFGTDLSDINHTKMQELLWEVLSYFSNLTVIFLLL